MLGINDRFIVSTLGTNVLIVGMKSYCYKVVIDCQSLNIWIYSVLSFSFKIKFNSFVPNIFSLFIIC